MPVVKMPNGDLVEFPNDMPREQIKAQILKWFPDAGKGAAEKPASKEAAEPQESTLQWAGRQALGFGKGVAQKLGSTVAGLGEVLPGGNLPGLPERAVKAREQAKSELKEFTDAPSESWAQSRAGYRRSRALVHSRPRHRRQSRRGRRPRTDQPVAARRSRHPSSLR
jgi:hypothetical protein